jgi:uncharacterized RDD family membrane protein YckC
MQAPPPLPPPTDATQTAPTLAGFGHRLLATLLDALWMLPLSWLLVLLGAALRGGPPGERYPTLAAEVLLNLIFGLLVLLFWVSRQATPGKLALRLRIVDARTGGHAPCGRLVLRYAGYLVSALPLGLGYLWMLWDRRRQTWQDKLGETLVVRDPPPPQAPPPPSTVRRG